jgi:hypothetical protein
MCKTSAMTDAAYFAVGWSDSTFLVGSNDT